MSSTEHITSAWGVLRRPTYRMFWITGLVSAIGGVIQDVTAGWWMTSLSSSPLMTALLQSAGSLPILFLALPGGALADTQDRRKLMLLFQSSAFVVAVLLGFLSLEGKMQPGSLLAFVALVGMANALHTPSWMRTVPDLLHGHEIPLGVTLNSAAVNIARAVGGLLAGILLMNTFTGAGFFANAVSFLPLLLVLLTWKREPSPPGPLPVERLPGALAAGWRYVWYSPVRNVQLRAFLFATLASALPALLPVLGRKVLHLDGMEFSALTATFGFGAILGAAGLATIQRVLSANYLIAAASALLGAAVIGIAYSPSLPLIYVLLLFAGAGWVACVSTFGIATGANSPPWVLSRALSFFALSFQGGVAIGSFVWGAIAAQWGVQEVFVTAGTAAVTSSLAAFLLPMQEGQPSRLAPVQYFPAPPVVQPEHNDQGPVLVSIEYKVARENLRQFLAGMEVIRLERLRNGALQWHLMVDPDQAELVYEYFLVASWLDHLRQHEHVTEADRDLFQEVRSLHQGPELPRVRHFLPANIQKEQE